MSANIILKASDDGQYTVEKKVAEKSGLIKMMIDGESDLFYLSQEGEDEGSAKQGWKWEEDVKSGRDYARVYATLVSRSRQSRHISVGLAQDHRHSESWTRQNDSMSHTANGLFNIAITDVIINASPQRLSIPNPSSLCLIALYPHKLTQYRPWCPRYTY